MDSLKKSFLILTLVVAFLVTILFFYGIALATHNNWVVVGASTVFVFLFTAAMPLYIAKKKAEDSSRSIETPLFIVYVVLAIALLPFVVHPLNLHIFSKANATKELNQQISTSNELFVEYDKTVEQKAESFKRQVEAALAKNQLNSSFINKAAVEKLIGKGTVDFSASTGAQKKQAKKAITQKIDLEESVYDFSVEQAEWETFTASCTSALKFFNIFTLEKTVYKFNQKYVALQSQATTKMKEFTYSATLPQRKVILDDPMACLFAVSVANMALLIAIYAVLQTLLLLVYIKGDRLKRLNVKSKKYTGIELD